MTIAWYDPTNHHVSTNKDDPLFTPLGQLWPLGRIDEAVEDDLNKMPTKIFGPNLVGILNAAGFYRKLEWVGLTDEDRMEIKKTVTYDQFETAGEYANRVQAATESKLKEENT